MLRVSDFLAKTWLLAFMLGAPVPNTAYSASVERHLVLTNNSHKLIVEMNVSDDQSNSWEEDVLELEFLPPGGAISGDIDEDQNGNCLVDVKERFDSGEMKIYRRINVC